MGLSKDLSTKIKFQKANPKRVGSDSHERYRKYCRATSVGEALYLGAWYGDIINDQKFGFLTVPDDAKKPSKKGNKKPRGNKNDRKPKAGKASRKPKARKAVTETRKKGQVFQGISERDGNYIAQRFFCFFGIVAPKNETKGDAEASLRAIDRVQSGVESRINAKVAMGKSSTPDDFVKYVRAAVKEEKNASPDSGVENWRYYSKKDKSLFSASTLRKFEKDPSISVAETEVRIRQDVLSNVLQGWLKFSNALGLTELNEIRGVDGMDSLRNAADEFARKELAALKKDEHPSDVVVLKALRMWGFDKSTSRPNVMPKGRSWIHSDTLGIIEDRKSHDLMVTSPCHGHENFVRLLSAWARAKSPSGELPFTTISLNKNYAGKMHRDSGNFGPSLGVALGPYKGGRLRYWANDSKKGARSALVRRVRREPSLFLNIKEGVAFDGNCAHEVEPFEGERYSMIFFTLKKYKEVSADVKRRMMNMGADWPTRSSLKRLESKVPKLVAK